MEKVGINVKKKHQLALTLAALTLFLAACSTTPITESSTGFWDRVIIYNLSQFIIWLSHVFGGSYGVGIILFTIITRIILIPLMHFQYKTTRQTAILQPKINALREQYSARDRGTQQKLQEEIAALYEREGVNQYAGCLPVALQLPVMIALYQAISRTEALKSGSFLWFQLDQADPYFILPILVVVTTFGTTWLSMKMQDSGVAGKVMLYLMPAFIGLTSLSFPSALSLYWVVGNIFMLGQTLLMNNPFKFLAEQEAIATEKKRREKALEKARRKHGKN